MKRLTIVLVLLLVPSAAALADGCPPSDCGTATVAVPGARTLAVRPGGSRGPAVVYDLARGRKLFTLPAGSLSADGRRHVVVRASRVSTDVARYDARTGRHVATWTLAGRWWLNALSADGRVLVVAKLVDGRRTVTELAVVDGDDGTVRRTIRLKGHIEAEAVSADGRRVFLVQWLRRGYVVRGYDVEARTLTTLRLKGEPTLMDGTSWGAVASADGRWLLTLYLDPEGGAAVHALDIARGTAVCIDLPSRGYDEARQYVFAVAPGSRTAIAANPAAGVVARIDLARTRLASLARFEPPATIRPFGNTAVATPTRAYFAGERYVWSYDLRAGTVGPRRDAGKRVLGLGVAPGGALRAVRFDGKVVTPAA
jgi:hypothetical protein